MSPVVQFIVALTLLAYAIVVLWMVFRSKK